LFQRHRVLQEKKDSSAVFEIFIQIYLIIQTIKKLF
jgi:hypothetical protein